MKARPEDVPRPNLEAARAMIAGRGKQVAAAPPDPIHTVSDAGDCDGAGADIEASEDGEDAAEQAALRRIVGRLLRLGVPCADLAFLLAEQD